MPHIGSAGDAVLVSITAGLMTLVSFLPALIGAILILVIGWFLADAVGRLVTTLLRRLGFEAAAERAGISRFIVLTGAHEASAARIFGELVKWFVRLIFIELAAQALHLEAVTTLINQIVLFIPNLAVALLILMVGVIIANFAGAIVRGSAGEMGIGSPNLMAGLARWAIIALAAIMAMHQIGIAQTIVDTFFMAFVGAIALAVGLSFGLGGREVAAQVWSNWYKTSRAAAKRLESAAAEGADASAASYEAGAQAEVAPPPPPAPYQTRHERQAG